MRSVYCHAMICLSVVGLPLTVAAQETIPLFDGESFDGWMATDGGPVPSAWEVADGAIHLSADGGTGGNIVTQQLFGDFTLRFEWKIAKNGNSGVKYRVREYGSRLLGCEYQILDDGGHSDAATPKKSTGSLYDLYPPNANKYLRPVGDFNESQIVVFGNRLEHWLNGFLIVSVDVGSWEWWDRKANSKFAETDGFGENRYGRIMLTDHNSDVWYRGLKLTVLNSDMAAASFNSGYCKPLTPRFRPFRWMRRRCR